MVKIRLPSTCDKCVQRWENYRDIQDARQEVTELKQSERERKPPQTYSTGYNHISTFFPKELEIFKDAMKSSEEENWTEAMLEEVKSLEEKNSAFNRTPE